MATTDEFIDSIKTEDDALDAIHRLRTKFDMSGTMFVRQDVTHAVINVMSEAPEEVAEFMTPHIVQEVMDDTRWKRLQDTLAERGNEAVGDIVVDICGLFASLPVGDDQALEVSTRNSEGKVIRKVVLDSADEVASEVQKAKVPHAETITVGTAYRVSEGGDVRSSLTDEITVWVA